MLKKNALFRITVPLTVKRKKAIQSLRKASECQNTAYFNLFLVSLTASKLINKWFCNGPPPAPAIYSLVPKPLGIISWSPEVCHHLVVLWPVPSVHRQHAQLWKTLPWFPFWRSVLAESSKAEKSVLHREFPCLLYRRFKWAILKF
jgi:hypothetical protein